MAVVNARDYQLAFSLNKQSAIGVAVAENKITKVRPIRGFAPATMEPTNVTDRQWYGKGHGFPTFVDRISKLYRLPAQERSATALELIWALAYVMGSDTITQPNSSLAYWSHALKFVSTTTQKEPYFTTIVEAMGAEFKKQLSGVWISSVTLTGNRADHVVLGFEGGGRLIQDSTMSMPVISNSAFFKTLFGTVAFGDVGAAADISAEVLSWTLTLNQNAQPMFLMGNSSGTEDLLSKVLIGDQSIAGNCVIMVSNAHRDRFLNQTECTMQLVLKSPDQIGTTGVKHTCTIDIPHCKIVGEAFGLEGTTVSYTLNFGEEGVLKSGADNPIDITVLSDVGDTELLVTG